MKTPLFKKKKPLPNSQLSSISKKSKSRKLKEKIKDIRSASISQGNKKDPLIKKKSKKEIVDNSNSLDFETPKLSVLEKSLPNDVKSGRKKKKNEGVTKGISNDINQSQTLTVNVEGTQTNMDAKNFKKKNKKKRKKSKKNVRAIQVESNTNSGEEMEEDVKNENNTAETASKKKKNSIKTNINVGNDDENLIKVKNIEKKKKLKKTVNVKTEERIRPGNELEKDDDSEFDMDSYPSDTDEEVGEPPLRSNFADISSEESSLDSSDDDSQHTFDADSYPSDTEDEEEKKKGLPVNVPPSAELDEKENRTIFVGNLPNSVERKQLKKWFFKFGNVENVRLRSAPIADPKLPRKVAVIKKAFHESRSNIHAYIRFKTIEAAKNALQANGALFDEHILRVDCSKHEGSYDSSRGVFVGNVPFDLEEDGMRNFFSECGDIDSVRIIRDKNTGVGKGFAYVNFKCSTAVALALKLDGETLGKRELRIKPIKYQKKNAKPFLIRQPPQYHSKKFYNKKPNNNKKTKKENKFQGEISQRRVKNNSKKKSADERKREKFSKILNNKAKTKNQS